MRSAFRNSTLERADIAVLTALPEELDALAQQAGWNPESDAGSVRRYYRSTTAGGLSVVSACALGMGQLDAALLTRDVVARFQPSAVVLTGIAAGVPSRSRLGDIAIAEEVVDYELQKLRAEGRQIRWSTYRGDPRLLGAARDLRERGWVRRIGVPRPDGLDPEATELRFGVVLSGNKVIAEEAEARALTSTWVQSVAIEMESVGVARSLYQMSPSPGFLVIKGVCDMANGGKSDLWHAYAAAAAAALTWTLLERLLTPALASGPTPDAQAAPDRTTLRRLLERALSLQELETLAFDLGIDWENLAGRAKGEKILALLGHLERRNRTSELVSWLADFERGGRGDGDS